MSGDGCYAIYVRVSSKGQDLLSQLEAARNAASRYNWPREEVREFKDNGISASKKGVNERKDFHRMLELIERGVIKKVLVRDRDRLARNFYEYAEVAHRLIELHVEVIFFQEGVPPFTGDIGMESIYGLFAQIETENLQRRVNDRLTLFPNKAPWGFVKNIDPDMENAKGIYYQPDDSKREFIVDLFEKVIQFSNFDGLSEYLARWGKEYKHSPEKILTNPFYCGGLLFDGQFQKLNHITGLVSYDQWRDANSHLNKVLQEAGDHHLNNQGPNRFNVAYSGRRREPHTSILPSKRVLCGECGSPMKLGLHKGAIVFRCRGASENKKAQKEDLQRQPHSQVTVARDFVEEQVQHVCTQMLDDIGVKTWQEKITKKMNALKRDMEGELNQTRTALDELRHNLIDAFAASPDGAKALDLAHACKTQRKALRNKERLFNEMESLQVGYEVVKKNLKSLTEDDWEELWSVIECWLKEVRIYPRQLDIQLYCAEEWKSSKRMNVLQDGVATCD